MQENISINKKLRSGIDLIEIKRLEKSYEKFGMRMLTTLYDESEIDIFSKRKGYNGARYLAKNFAGKEAVSKVLGYGFTNGVRPRDIIIHRRYGGPEVELKGKAKDIAKKIKLTEISISLSDTDSLAVAVAHAIKEDT